MLYRQVIVNGVILLFIGVVLLPGVAQAQSGDLQGLMLSIMRFISGLLIPFFFALAILFLFINVTRYFIIDASDTYARQEARNYILYAVIALVFFAGFWGIINVINSSLGIDGGRSICPDYIGNCDSSDGGTARGGANPFDDGVFDDGAFNNERANDPFAPDPRGFRTAPSFDTAPSSDNLSI